MTTEAGKRLLLGLPDRGTGLVAINTESLTEAIAAIEAEAVALTLDALADKVEGLRDAEAEHDGLIALVGQAAYASVLALIAEARP